jgi:hypothetical protein
LAAVEFEGLADFIKARVLAENKSLAAIHAFEPDAVIVFGLLKKFLAGHRLLPPISRPLLRFPISLNISSALSAWAAIAAIYAVASCCSVVGGLGSKRLAKGISNTRAIA